MNQCFLDMDPSQTEALIQPHQARAFGVIVDDCARCYIGANGLVGGQYIKTNGVHYGMHFGGWKCYFRISKPTMENLVTYPIVELTNPVAYEPPTQALF